VVSKPWDCLTAQQANFPAFYFNCPDRSLALLESLSRFARLRGVGHLA